ncbi:hypothetical protein PJ267_01290 [Arthrobacter sp. OVS8]|nr:hypothetical protein PJ267_01290 [Arthrobacter sp. OVS8]
MVTMLVIAAAGAYAATAFGRFQESRTAASTVRVGSSAAVLDKASVLFRNTAPGQGYGTIGVVPLSDPAGERSLAAVACDRVYGTLQHIVCLKTNRGLVTNFEAVMLTPDWRQAGSWSLPGIPSRTRISPDGSLVATTVFVSGHSYGNGSFSTATSIASVQGGTVAGNLEDFALLVNGARVTAADRNIWGVTFAPGQRDTFYATAASSGRIWLVKGSISARTLTAVHDGVECPSLSPDGTRIAYKKNTGVRWPRTGASRTSIWPAGRKPCCPSRAAWMTRSNGSTTRRSSMDSPATVPPATATSGRSTPTRRPVRRSTSSTPGRRP